MCVNQKILQQSRLKKCNAIKNFNQGNHKFWNFFFYIFLLTINLKLIIVHVEIKIVNKEAATKRSTLLHAKLKLWYKLSLIKVEFIIKELKLSLLKTRKYNPEKREDSLYCRIYLPRTSKNY